MLPHIKIGCISTVEEAQPAKTPTPSPSSIAAANDKDFKNLANRSSA
jgi:hypothetical protein